MKKQKLVSFGLVIILILVSCSPSTPKGSLEVVKDVSIGKNLVPPQLLDIEAPLPSPGAALLMALAVDEPGVAALVDDVEASERAAIQAVIDELQAQLPQTSSTGDLTALAASISKVSNAARPAGKSSFAKPAMVPVVYVPPAAVRSEKGSLSAASMVGLLVSMFGDTFINQLPAMPTKSFSQSEKEANATTDMSAEMGRGEDGSTNFAFGLKSEALKDGASAKTDMYAKIEGQRCPNAEGQVSFTIKARLGSEAGGAGSTQDLTTFVRATVGDDAEVTSTTFDVIQGTRSIKGGVGVYVETGMTTKYGPNYSDGKGSNERLIRNSQNATREDVANSHELELSRAGIGHSITCDGSERLAEWQVRQDRSNLPGDGRARIDHPDPRESSVHL